MVLRAQEAGNFAAPAPVPVLDPTHTPTTASAPAKLDRAGQ